MTFHSVKLKVIWFDIGGSRFEIQVKSWNMNNNTGDPEKLYTFHPDGEKAEAAEDEYALELSFYSDWRSQGINDFLTLHDGETLPFQLDHHPDIPSSHVRWNGSVQIKAPSAGGEVRTTEETSTTLAVIGKPVYTRP